MKYYLLLISLDQLQNLGWIISAATALLAIYFNRKARPIEQVTTELQIIQTRNEFLETRNEFLEKREIELSTLAEERLSELSTIKERCSHIEKELEETKIVVKSQDDLMSEVLEAQIAALLMRNQLQQIVNRFGISDSIEDKIKKK